jgi:ATP-binding cassette, subfamily B (MDR/TAP), member 1
MAFIRVPRLAGFIVTVIPLAALLFAGVSTLSDKVSRRTLEVDGKSNTFLEQILSSIRVVKAFAAEKVLIEKYDVFLMRVCHSILELVNQSFMLTRPLFLV